MPFKVASLKLDFKIDEQGMVRIIDLGDGLSAGITGFEDTPLDSQVLHDIHEKTQASIATLFGELTYESMQEKSMHIPLLLRNPTNLGIFSADDLPDTPILPFTYPNRFTSFLSAAWKDKSHVLEAPLALLATEQHKIFWYLLAERHMTPATKPQVIYWSNDTKPTEIKFDDFDLSHGVFIKIGDRSDGGGMEVFYAKNKADALGITTQLYIKYRNSTESFKKHIYIIEPAYLTLKKFEKLDYNVTGRAFVSIFYDLEQQILSVKIAAAKWMLPLKTYSLAHTEDQMLSNVKQSVKMVALNAKELETLAESIEGMYAKTFKAGFMNNDLLTYFAAHPQLENIRSCLRPNSSYLVVLKSLYLQEEGAVDKQHLLFSLMNSLLQRNYLQAFVNLLSINSISSSSPGMFPPSSDRTGLIKYICLLSFFENYVVYLKAANNPLVESLPFLSQIKKNESTIKLMMNKFISRYLATFENPKYTTNNLDKALREASYYGDYTTAKILIYTRRADVNNLSPSNKTALDYAMSCKVETAKEPLLRLLQQVGAKSGEAIHPSASSIPSIM